MIIQKKILKCIVSVQELTQNPLNQDRLEYAVIDKDLYSPELNSTDSTPYKNLLTNDPDFSGAIGAIISTDVLCLRIKDKKEIIGRDGFLDREMPSAHDAVVSFAEFIKLSAAQRFDVDSREFKSGFRSYRLPDNEINSYEIWISDSLENGAGFTRELSQKDNLKSTLEEGYLTLQANWENKEHAICDSSCQDCIRNYANRFLHSSLDWRLALDLAEAVLGKDINYSRWLDQSEHLAKIFQQYCNVDNKINVTIEQLGSLIAVHAKEKKAALILIPPLWHEKQGLIENIEAVNSALSMLKADFGPDVMPIWTGYMGLC